MAKQTELRHLLDTYCAAAQRHVALLNDRTASVEQRAAELHKMSDAEKRIFSLFDRINNDLETYKRINGERMDAIAALTKERDSIKQGLASALEMNRTLHAALPKRNDAPAPQYEPFDVSRAAAGEPFEVLHDGAWKGGAKYVGTTERGVVVECAHVAGVAGSLSYWTINNMRMTPQTQQVQMFANVRRLSSGVLFGALYDAKKIAELNAQTETTSGTLVVTAFPVTITVAK